MSFASRPRSNRLFPTPPSSGVKRAISDDNLRISKLPTLSCSETGEKDALYSKDMIEECTDKDQLFEIYGNLKRNNIELEKKLHKLQVVKQHHSKIVPKDLDMLIEKWVTTAQTAIIKLFEEFPEPKPNEPLDLINNLRIDPAVVKYDPDLHTFHSK